MVKEYTQLKEIKLQDILDLDNDAFKAECLDRLAECGFIKKEEPEWERITMRNLNEIRNGVTIKRTFDRRDLLIHVTSDPYWSSWRKERPHILVFSIKRGCGLGIDINGANEYSINDLFTGNVYILRN